MIDQHAVRPRSIQSLVEDAFRVVARHPIVFILAIISQFAVTFVLRFMGRSLQASGTDLGYLTQQIAAATNEHTESGQFSALQYFVEARNGIAHDGAAIASAGLTLFITFALVRIAMYAYFAHDTPSGGAHAPTDSNVFDYIVRKFPRLLLFEVWSYAGWFFFASAAVGLAIIFALLLQFTHTGAWASAVLSLLFVIALIVATAAWGLLTQMALVRCVTREEPPLESLAVGIAESGSRLGSIIGFALMTAIFGFIATVLSMLLAHGIEQLGGARVQGWQPLRHVFAGIILAYMTSVIFAYSIDHLVRIGRHPQAEPNV